MTRSPIRYRPLSITVWNDDRFTSLSAAAPNAQTLWLWLLTGPLTLVVPGLIPVGSHGITERLRWPLRAVRRTLAEIEAVGMAHADEQAPLIWLPKAPRHHRPANPNVVRGWRRSFDEEVPSSPLRERADLTIADYLSTLGPTFTKPWRQRSQHGLPERSVKQEQEQEQEDPDPEVVPDRHSVPSSGPEDRPRDGDGWTPDDLPDEAPDPVVERVGAFLEAYQRLYRQVLGARYHVRPAHDAPAARRLCATWSDGRLRQMAELFLKTDEPWIRGTGRTLGVFESRASWCDARLAEHGIDPPPDVTQEAP